MQPMAIQKSSAFQPGWLLLMAERLQEEFHKQSGLFPHFHEEITDLQMLIPVYTCYVIWAG